MKLLVVAQPIKQFKNKEKYSMPLGIAYINGALRAAGFDVNGINMMFVEGNPYEVLYEEIKRNQYDILLCGGLSAEYPILKEIYDIAKKANENIITIGGGGGFSASPILFSELTGVDYAVIGEGELTDVELIRALENHKTVSEIEGIVYKDENGYHQTKPRKPIENLDHIPFPSYEGLGIEEYLDNQQIDGWYNYYTYYSDNPRMMPMLMSRSCPYMCSFCFHPMGRGYRGRSLDNFFEELELWIEKYHINGIALVDECFSMNPQTVIDFCHRIKKYNIAWACQMRAEIYSNELMSEMKKSGCIGACFGIESMSQAVLANMNKHLRRETIENALEISYKCEIGTSGNLIFGAENETFDTVWESVQWNREHVKTYGHQPIKAFTYIQTYPGSEYCRNAIHKGLIKDEARFIKEGQWIQNITTLSDKDYGIIGEAARFLQYERRPRGRVLNVEIQGDKRITVSFVCPHCNQTHTYHNLNNLHLKDGIIRNLGCRKCNGMADYLLDESYYEYERYYLVDWLINKLDVGNQEEVDRLIASSISRFKCGDAVTVGIAGAGYVAERLVDIVEDYGVGISIQWIYKRNDINVFSQSQDKVVDGKRGMSFVDLIIDTEPLDVERMNNYKQYANIVINLELLVRDAIEELKGTESVPWKLF